EIVGEAHASADAGTLERLAQTTLPTGSRPSVCARPACTEEVQAIMLLARRHGLHVYPISKGKYWGYGDACAPRAGCLLIDLGRMNRILEVNTRLAYAVVEPGVTQRQLFDYLEERRIPLWMDATGAGPDASVLGNILERGVGLSPHSDRFAHSCGLEVVLPDGQLVRTGMAAFEGSKTENLARWGCGPALDGLFTQANLGIVTRLTFWLMPRPEEFCAFFLRLRRDESIVPVIDVLRQLRLQGTTTCSVHCFNGLRILGSSTRYPYDQHDGTQPLELESPQLVEALMKKHQVPTWMVSGSLTGTREEVAAKRKIVRRAFARLADAQLTFVDRRRLSLIGWLRRHLPRWRFLDGLRTQLDRVFLWVNFLQGRTDHGTLKGSHWRARGQAGPDQDPRASGSGLIWICPLLPMTSEATAAVQEIGRRHFHAAGFEYQVTLSQVSDRALCAVMSLHFERTSAEETRRAAACHDALTQELVAAGYIPYRGAPQTVKHLHDAAPAYWETCRRLKEALDPALLLAPGRYIPE
ncbi:MAG: FAD-binding oxidoreductase, partial [Gemmataceae bacterium]